MMYEEKIYDDLWVLYFLLLFKIYLDNRNKQLL